jgi:hypothetical protein
MNDSALDDTLAGLAASESACRCNPDFCACVWQRVGRLQEARERKTRLWLGAGVAVVALGTGFGTVGAPYYTHPQSRISLESSQLAPSALLHVSE